MITVTVDTSRLDRVMSDFPLAMARAQRKALAAIGQQMATRATQAFRIKAFRPSPWAPRKDKKATHPLLIRSGALRQSIRWHLKGMDTVVAGSPHQYCIYHQFGTKRMPARPFFPIDKNGRLVPAMERKIVRTVEAAIRLELGG